MIELLESRMYPYVVAASWIDTAALESLVSWQVSEDIFIILVLEDEGTVRNVRPDDLAALGLDQDAAFQSAAQNLASACTEGQFQVGSATLRDGLKIGLARGNWMAPAGGLLLGNFHAALSQEFGGKEFAAIAVNQECLIAFPLNGETMASEALRIAVDEEYRGHRKPISRSWLLLDGGWPRPYPGTPAF